MTTKQDNLTKIGALWLKITRNTGREFFSGSITIDGKTVDVVMFHNKYSTPENQQPQFNIFVSDREQTPDTMPTTHPF